jgi:hypothetical protein
MVVIHQQGSCKFPPAASLFPYFVAKTGDFYTIPRENFVPFYNTFAKIGPLARASVGP